jgi:hypothetical protein
MLLFNCTSIFRLCVDLREMICFQKLSKCVNTPREGNEEFGDLKGIVMIDLLYSQPSQPEQPCDLVL